MAASIRELEDAESWLREFSTYQDNLTKLKDNEYTNLLNKMDDYHSAQNKLAKSVDLNKKNLKAFATSLQKIKKKGGEEKENVEVMKSKIESVQPMFSQFQQVLPKTAGWFLKACLGDVNVSLFQNKLHYKEVYEKFKLKTMMLAMVYSVVNLFFINAKLTDAIFNGLLVWYYSSLTLQEQILRVNGSRIKGWYVAHHYLSILVSGFLLIWPSSASYQQFRTQFYCFVLYLSFLQLLQYHYQKGILYKLRALGHGEKMDTTQDGVRPWLHANSTSWKIRLLIPALIGGYVFQFYNGYTLYLISIQEECREWQVLASAIMFALLSVGNLITLYFVLARKGFFERQIHFPCS